MPSTTARLFTTAVVASSALLATAQTTTPLAAKSFSYPDGIPYKVDTDDGPRGIQTGINLCNATTEGQDSRCQTSFINSIEDFCLWAPPEPDSVVGNTEGEMVAWCTQPGRGTRLIPEGALKGVQFTRAPSYVQVVGFIDQTLINIQADDYGGEMDPHGADRRGNPLGGIMFSQAFGRGNGSAWTQVVQWHNFMGGNMFCLKACDPADENDWHYCEHIFDRIGCAYNAPADYANINGTFTSCESENQRYPGVYVNSNGQTVTYTQPPESLGAITTIPYTAEIPSSSQCTTYTSSNLWSSLAPGPSVSLNNFPRAGDCCQIN
ncbi:hypothetical protein P389DRAFT_93414 [Cystobasidium minutum MCA 4210]|uniref:uncharacterized protein n=1 Tax=Cystobasidium minutum MCA 4210 TaxID=1397322 RepID=UPI0034CE306F|eukprot:jgi/Rhomi1/93414/CE93413_3238